MNLFAQAKTQAPVAKSKKQHEEFTINDGQFHQEVVRLTVVNKQLDELDAESKLLTSSIKERAKTEYLKVFEETKKFPETVIFRGMGLPKIPTAQFMFMAQDRYIKIDQERAQQLKNIYGEKVVEETTTYTMDSKLIEKYGSVISKLILESKEINDEDKLKLIQATTEYNVAKGTIQNALGFNKPLNEVTTDVNPVFMMRNVKIEDENI